VLEQPELPHRDMNSPSLSRLKQIWSDELTPARSVPSRIGRNSSGGANGFSTA
jgi:hypothetical protein